MAIDFLYASFPNSRIKPRTATATAATFQTSIGKIGDPLSKVLGEDPNRTYALLTNLDASIAMLYLYADTQPIDPSVVATYGVKYDLLYNNISNTLYQKQDDGLNTNWVVVLPQNVAEKVLPYQSAQLESLQAIYALANDAVSGINIAVDFGIG